MTHVCQLKAELKPCERNIEDELAIINGLKTHKPAKMLTADDVLVRELVILGEAPTAYYSIHPEGEINGQNLKVLSQIIAKLVGAPMLDGHRSDKVPWGRVYKASLVTNGKEKQIQLGYYFVNNAKGRDIAENIDAGVYAEWSISYRFECATCSICHKSKFDPLGGCKHKIGQKDPATGMIAYWYPKNIVQVMEVSNVFRGAYPKTKNIPTTYSEEEAKEFEELRAQINDEICDGGSGKPFSDNNMNEITLDDAFPTYIVNIKPVKTERINNEYFGITAFKSLPSGKYYVDPKYDGVWFALVKKDGNVKLLTDEKNDHAAKFPTLIKESQSISGNAILFGEMVKYNDRQRMKHEDVTKYLHGTKIQDDGFKFKLFDAAYLNGKDIRSQPFSERRKQIDGIENTSVIHKTAIKPVQHVHGSDDIVRVMEDRKTREGVVVRSADMQYDNPSRSKMWKWKLQYEVDAIVVEKTDVKSGIVYDCGVKEDGKVIPVGRTYVTKVEAGVGDILRVSVDKVTLHDDGTWSWTAPKVLTRKSGDPDTVETLRRISEVTGKGERLFLLGSVVSALTHIESFGAKLWLVGGLVENGMSRHDIDIVTDVELSVEKRLEILGVLGALDGEVDFIVDSGGPAGPAIELRVAPKTWKYKNRFVLQEHGWGKKVHWDLRFGAPRTPRMWGFTLFSSPLRQGVKVRAQEKKYHDPAWMEIDKERIRVGEAGHPGKDTYGGDAWMKRIDIGTYEFVKREQGFLELILHGEKLAGRYLFREIRVDGSIKRDRLKDEIESKDEKIWIFWKPKNQVSNSDSPEICSEVVNGNVYMWEVE